MYINIKKQNDKLFKEENFPDMHSYTIKNNDESMKSQYNGNFRVSDHIVKKTTVAAILDCPHDKKIIALNFANAMFPGGGYILGGNAQEESLCRASFLYYTIRTQKEYYRRNRLHILPDYTDTLIYSENVPMIRDDKGQLLEKRSCSNFITVPAVNRTFAKFIFSGKKITDKMTRRIEMIIDCAVKQHPDFLILGAFGCGVFGNRREEVFDIFEKIINKRVPENITILFAVP